MAQARMPAQMVCVWSEGCAIMLRHRPSMRTPSHVVDAEMDLRR